MPRLDALSPIDKKHVEIQPIMKGSGKILIKPLKVDTIFVVTNSCHMVKIWQDILIIDW